MAQGFDKARKVPLVRAEGFPYNTGEHATSQRLAADPRFLRSFKSTRTAVAEEVLGLGDCLYFYVGYACPRFGDMVFVYDPAVSASWPGSATPFDSGGIIGYIHANGLPGKDLEGEKCRYAAPLSDSEKTIFREYVQAHRIVDLRTWQPRFDAFLATHYDRAADYVRAERPKGDDPTGRHLHPRNDREAWTWEIQAHRDHGILNGLWLLRMSSEKEQMLRQALEDLPENDPWWQALGNASIFAPCSESEGMGVCREAERVILSWL